ncbi:MAG: phosphoglycolate phosphatase [Candidatus Nitrosocaldaceae archaeon]|nr:MAG: phosphoglycolate phosphatase [Candidatus Nitrosocaldaceae archaeon]
MHKILAVDIDGTLTDNGGGIINLEALSMLRNLVRLGYKVVFVSGRSSVEGYILAMFGGLTRVAVGENGGAITTSPSNHILLADKSYSLKAYEILRKSLDNVKLKDVFPRLTEVVLQRTFDIREGAKILKEHNLPVIITDSMYAYHLNYKDINKAVGFKKVLDMFNIKEEEAIAIGDSETDLPLFNLCSYSIALANASDDVKRHANYITRYEEGKGLVEAIEHIVLSILR